MVIIKPSNNDMVFLELLALFGDSEFRDNVYHMEPSPIKSKLLNNIGKEKFPTPRQRQTIDPGAYHLVWLVLLVIVSDS